MTHKKSVTVTVKCVTCGKKREITPGKSDSDDFPMCPDCGMLMLSEKATARLS